MIIDTSAVLAIMFGESDAQSFEKAIVESPRSRMSVVSFLEAAIVLESRGGPDAGHELDTFPEDAGIELVPVTYAHAAGARQAWRRFGRGNHPAGLNFGDCFAYALAVATSEPLLFKGQDFALTDVVSA